MDSSIITNQILPWTFTTLAVSYALYLNYKIKCNNSVDRSKLVNPNQMKDSVKVVDTFDIEDLEAKTSFCRCWRSKKFPYCDGSHNAYNKETGDNLGPVNIQKKL